MSWVEHPSYIGPDRRKQKGLRLLERRRRSFLTDRPTLAAALRRLKLDAIDVDNAEREAAYRIRVQGVALLARETHRPDIAAVLEELALALNPEREGPPDQRATIGYTLAASEELWVQRAPRQPLPPGLRR
jgi:hypothetical protein